MPKITIISLSNLKKDPRVQRQISFLKDRYKLTCLGFENPEIEDVDFRSVSVPMNKFRLAISYVLLLLNRFEWFYWAQPEIKLSLQKMKDLNHDLIIANDVDVLPLCLKIASNSKAKVLFDAHEFAPLEHNDSFLWRILFKRYKHYLIKKYAHKADGMLTVCDGIAEKFKNEYNLNPVVITNAAFYHDILIQSSKDPNSIRLIHHGIAMPTRQIEKMIEMMDYLDERFSLDLMLVRSKSAYYNQLMEMSKSRKNVRFIEPVETSEIIQFTSRYDIGVYILEPTNFNNHFALPNKLFEFIQARLAIAIGPSPEMAKIVKQYNLGIVADDFSPKTFAKILNEITPEKMTEFKLNAEKASKILNANQNQMLFQLEIDKLIQHKIESSEMSI